MKRIFLFVFIWSAFVLTLPARAYDLVVAKDGSSNYKTIQAAIDAAPESATKPFRIFIKAGTYTEQLVIPETKPFIELIGEDVAKTVINFSDGRAGTTVLTIRSDDCLLANLTIENTQGRIADGPQSLALKTQGDRIVIVHCRFISGQDTVMVNGLAKRVYFLNCYIDGNTDFIYGPAIAAFDKCVIYARDRVDGNPGGYITAANTPEGQKYGLVFRDCIIPDNHGVTRYTLGRPWQNDHRTEEKGRKRAENKVVFLNTKMGNSVLPQGWSVWDKGTITDRITYAEYRSRDFNGLPVDVSRRESWTRQLSDAEAAPYYNDQNLFGNWVPLKRLKGIDNATNDDFVVTNFIPRYSKTDVSLQFNTSWPVTNAVFKVFRAADKNGPFKAIGLAKSRAGGMQAYQYNVDMPAEGQSIYYYIQAVKDRVHLPSDTVELNVSKIPVKLR